MKNKIIIVVAGAVIVATIFSIYYFANQYRAGGENGNTIFTVGSTKLTIISSENEIVLMGEKREAVLDLIEDLFASDNCTEENVAKQEYDLILDCNNGYQIYISTLSHLITYAYTDDDKLLYSEGNYYISDNDINAILAYIS